MPILTPGVAIPTPPPITDPEIPVTPEPQILPSYRRKISWVTPALSTAASSRTEIPLTGDIRGLKAGIIVQPGVKGLDAAPYSLKLDDLPALDGSVFRSVRATTREIMLPLFLWAPDRAALVDLKRSLLKAMNPRKGSGTLVLVETDADGNTSTRYIDCLYAGGLEGDEAEGRDFICCVYGLTLQAPDPFFYGSLTGPGQEYVFDSTKPVNFFTGKPTGDPNEHVGPFLPIHLSISTYVGDQTYVISNVGDLEAWPVWTIAATGAKTVTMQQLDTGETFSLDYGFSSKSDLVTIDTRPGFKTVSNSAGQSLWGSVGNSNMFRLQPGTNRIKITFTPSSDVAVVSANVKYTFYPKYLGA